MIPCAHIYHGNYFVLCSSPSSSCCCNLPWHHFMPTARWVIPDKKKNLLPTSFCAEIILIYILKSTILWLSAQSPTPAQHFLPFNKNFPCFWRVINQTQSELHWTTLGFLKQCNSMQALVIKITYRSINYQ